MGRVLLERLIYSSELDRGFDILELQPSDQLSENEIAAAKLVRFDGVQSAEPAEDRVAGGVPGRSLVPRPAGARRRSRGGRGRRRSAARSTRRRSRTGKARRNALNALAKQVDEDVAGAKDPARVKAMSAAIKELAKATK